MKERQLTPDQIRRFRKHLIRDEKSAATVEKYLRDIRRFSDFLGTDSVWAQMKRLCSRAGIKPGKVFPHNLRKLFDRSFYSMEKDIAKLADILGHSSIDTTRIYIMSTGTEHRRKLERLGLLL